MKKKHVSRIVTTFFLIVISLISLYPFYTMVMMATYKTEDIFKGIPFLPSGYLIENLKVVMSSNFVRPYLNSIFVLVTATGICVLVSAMAGFGLTVYRFRAKKAMMKFIMMTMMVPSQIGIIGFMVEMRKMYLGGTIWPLILGWFASGFGAYWMAQFTRGALPLELVECSRIDGCNELRIFWQISMPCIKPGLVTLALLIFLWSWNSYLGPLVLVSRPDLYTIPIFIRTLGNAYRTDYGAQIAGLVLATIPLVVMFVLGSRNFIKGLTAGAVKG